jgi:hypothetical protein
MRSLLTLRVGKRAVRLVPLASLYYGALSIVIVLAVGLFVDRVAMTSLERRGLVSGALWAEHNALMRASHELKSREQDGCVCAWLGHPVSKDSSEGARGHRILVLGDSFVYGSAYLTQNHMWWRQLAIELERRGYRDVEVIAAGRSGFSTRQELDCAKRVVPIYKPSLILFGYVTNDPDEGLIPTLREGPLAQLPSSPRHLFPRLWFKLNSLRREKLAKQYAGPEWGYPYEEWELKLLEGENFARYQETLRDVGAFLAEAKVPAFMMTLPNRPELDYFNRRYATPLPAFRKAGVPVHDTLADFVARHGNVTGADALVWGINPDDGHPGARAGHFLAREAADILERDHAAALGPKSASPPAWDVQVNDWTPPSLDVSSRGAETGAFSFTYPDTERGMPAMPLTEPTVILGLTRPVRGAGLRIEGDSLEKAAVWVSTVDPEEGYHDEKWTALEPEGPLLWRLPEAIANREISVIRMRGALRAGARKVELTLLPPGPEHRP